MPPRLSSSLESDCLRVQLDGLGTHDCARSAVEMVNVFPMVLSQSPVTALNPQLPGTASSVAFKAGTGASTGASASV